LAPAGVSERSVQLPVRARWPRIRPLRRRLRRARADSSRMWGRRGSQGKTLSLECDPDARGAVQPGHERLRIARRVERCGAALRRVARGGGGGTYVAFLRIE